MPVIRVEVPAGTPADTQETIRTAVKAAVLKTLAPKETKYDYRAWTISTAAPAPPLNGGEDEISQVPGRPLRTCPALRPRRTSDPRPLQDRRWGLPFT